MSLFGRRTTEDYVREAYDTFTEEAQPYLFPDGETDALAIVEVFSEACGLREKDLNAKRCEDLLDLWAEMVHCTELNNNRVERIRLMRKKYGKLVRNEKIADRVCNWCETKLNARFGVTVTDSGMTLMHFPENETSQEEEPEETIPPTVLSLEPETPEESDSVTEETETPESIAPETEKAQEPDSETEAPEETAPETEETEAPEDIVPESEETEAPEDIMPALEETEVPEDIVPEPEETEAPEDIAPEAEETEASEDIASETEKMELPEEPALDAPRTETGHLENGSPDDELSEEENEAPPLPDPKIVAKRMRIAKELNGPERKQMLESLKPRRKAWLNAIMAEQRNGARGAVGSIFLAGFVAAGGKNMDKAGMRSLLKQYLDNTGAEKFWSVAGDEWKKDVLKAAWQLGARMGAAGARTQEGKEPSSMGQEDKEENEILAEATEDEKV